MRKHSFSCWTEIPVMDHTVIPLDFDVFTKLSDGSIILNKPEIFNALWRNTRHALSG